MCQSNQIFNTPFPLPGQTPGHLNIFCAQEVGNLKGLPRAGDMTFAWVWWGKLRRNKLKGRDMAFVSNLLTKKNAFKFCVLFLYICMRSKECKYE